MTRRIPRRSKSYEEIMRGSGQRRAAIAARTLANERRIRAELESLEEQRTSEERNKRVLRDLRLHAERMHMSEQIAREISLLELKRKASDDSDERVVLKAEIVHLQMLRSNLAHWQGRKPRRKPPESGIAVPAVPPKGPVPKQGGAEAPLEFDD